MVKNTHFEMLLCCGGGDISCSSTVLLNTGGPSRLSSSYHPSELSFASVSTLFSGFIVVLSDDTQGEVGSIQFSEYQKS